jgi:hypothetical protein
MNCLTKDDRQIIQVRAFLIAELWSAIWNQRPTPSAAPGIQATQVETLTEMEGNDGQQ